MKPEAGKAKRKHRLRQKAPESRLTVQAGRLARKKGCESMTVNGINPAASLGELKLRHEAELAGQKTESAFSKALREKAGQESRVRFSRHAAARIAERSGELSQELLEDLNRAVETAREKGSRDTLILQGQNAFIVNVPNNVVVTMVSYQDMKETEVISRI